jgi:hypothetical protein
VRGLLGTALIRSSLHVRVPLPLPSCSPHASIHPVGSVQWQHPRLTDEAWAPGDEYCVRWPIGQHLEIHW